MKRKNIMVEESSDLISHLIELRNRLLYVVGGIAAVTLALLPFANRIYTFFATPLLERLPEGTSMIAVDVTAPFFVPFKLVMFLAIFITVPFSLYHVWAFVAPGLYQREKRFLAPLLISSTLLFYLGIAFAFFVVFPVVFTFIIGIAPEGIAVMTDIARYLDFVIALFLAFGLAFETPVATVLLVATGVTTTVALESMRPYVIVAVFVIGMLLTPPDVVSQIMLAIPMWILYESGILAARVMQRQRNNGPSTEADR